VRVSLTVNERKLNVIIRYFPSAKICLFLSLRAHKRSGPFSIHTPQKHPSFKPKNDQFVVAGVSYKYSYISQRPIFAGIVQLLAPSTNPATHLDVKIPFWATVSKTVRPMLSVRCLSVLSVCL